VINEDLTFQDLLALQVFFVEYSVLNKPGYAAITLQDAALWTDGRYYNQAEKQLDSNWKLMKSGLPGVPTLSEWLSSVIIFSKIFEKFFRLFLATPELEWTQNSFPIVSSN
jgi:hypothetical protein